MTNLVGLIYMYTALILGAVVAVQQLPVLSTLSTSLRKDLVLLSLNTSANSLEAVYTSGVFQFELGSALQTEIPSALREPDLTSYIVSTVSVTNLDRDVLQHTTLTQMAIPGLYQHQRKIPDMERRIVHAAKYLLEVIQTTELRLQDLADLYEGMVETLVHKVDVQSDFNQVRASATYHSSIVKAAQRLANGASPESACPPHQAYDRQGLFACQQEYLEHVLRVLPDLLRTCQDESCRQNFLGIMIEKVIGQLDAKDMTDAAEEIYSLLGNNSQLAQDIARLIACGNISCVEPGCGLWLYNDGWHIYGADWGCCGDYSGCCYLATEVCLVHDAICTCCSFPTFCLDPFCEPDAWCNNTTTTAALP